MGSIPAGMAEEAVVAVGKQPPRPLPDFTRWPGKMWCFNYKRTLYFTGKDSSGRWYVVPEEDQLSPLLVVGKASKALAVRTLMDLVDRSEGEA